MRMAAEKGHLDVVECLVDNEADISIQDSRGVSNTSIKKFLNENKDVEGWKPQKQP